MTVEHFILLMFDYHSPMYLEPMAVRKRCPEVLSLFILNVRTRVILLMLCSTLLFYELTFCTTVLFNY